MKNNRIYGIHSLEEALKTEQEIDKIFILKGTDNPGLLALANEAKKKRIALSWVPVQKLNKLTTGNHQGVVATIAPITTWVLKEMVEKAFKTTDNPLFLLCDQVTDVHNFGAIIRSAECAGAQGVIIPKQGSAALNEQVVKTSAGAIFNIPICKVDHLKDALYFLKTYDVQCIAATEKGNEQVYAVNFKQPSAIIMGSEGKGIANSLLKLCDHKAKLPLLGKTESLNVSVACALFLYEAVRQKLG